MAALHRAIAIEQAHDAAVGVGEDLHFDVARLRKVALQQQPVVAEGGARQPLRRFDRRARLRRRNCTTCMPLPPPPALALMMSGKPTRCASAASRCGDCSLP